MARARGMPPPPSPLSSLLPFIPNFHTLSSHIPPPLAPKGAGLQDRLPRWDHHHRVPIPEGLLQAGVWRSSRRRPWGGLRRLHCHQVYLEYRLWRVDHLYHCNGIWSRRNQSPHASADSTPYPLPHARYTRAAGVGPVPDHGQGGHVEALRLHREPYPLPIYDTILKTARHNYPPPTTN